MDNILSRLVPLANAGEIVSAHSRAKARSNLVDSRVGRLQLLNLGGHRLPLLVRRLTQARWSASAAAWTLTLLIEANMVRSLLWADPSIVA